MGENYGNCNGGFGGGNWIWIIILLLCCCDGGSRGCGKSKKRGCGGDGFDIWWIIILLIFCGCGNGNSCGNSGYVGGTNCGPVYCEPIC